MELDVVDEKPLIENSAKNFYLLEGLFKNYIDGCKELEKEINKIHNFQDKEKLQKL